MQQENVPREQQFQWVKADPQLPNLRYTPVLLWVTSGMMLLIALFSLTYFFSKVGVFHNYIVFYLLLAAMNGFNAINIGKRKRRVQQLEWKRQAAASAHLATLLADEQPIPNMQALTLPLTIKVRPRWDIILFSSLIAMVFISISIGVLYSVYPFPGTTILTLFSSPILLTVVAVALIVIATLFITLFITMYVQAREQVTLTEYGIMLVGIKKVSSIPWGEVRLFAISASTEGLLRQNVLRFEVSSEREIIRWYWLPPAASLLETVRQRVLYPAQPVLPQHEYDLLMQRMQSVIAGKTGQPLYDLRKV